MGLSNYLPSSRLIQPGVIANSGERPASPYEGMVVFQKDTNQTLVWDGSAWVMVYDLDSPPGLEKITPTSATNGTVGSSGTVSATANSNTLTINGVFSSTYQAYLVVVTDWKQTDNAELQIALGTAFTGTAHRFSGLYTNTSGQSTGIGNAGIDNIPVGVHASSSDIGGGSILIYNPWLSQITTVTAHNADMRSGGIPFRISSGGVMNTTSYTAFILRGSGGNISTMNVAVYGYRY